MSKETIDVTIVEDCHNCPFFENMWLCEHPDEYGHIVDMRTLYNKRAPFWCPLRPGWFDRINKSFFRLKRSEEDE